MKRTIFLRRLRSRSYAAACILLAVTNALAAGTVEIDVDLNGRADAPSGPDFTNRGRNTIKYALAPKTQGDIIRYKNFSSGNVGYYVKLTTGPHRGDEVWVLDNKGERARNPKEPAYLTVFDANHHPTQTPELAKSVETLKTIPAVVAPKPAHDPRLDTLLKAPKKAQDAEAQRQDSVVTPLKKLTDTAPMLESPNGCTGSDVEAVLGPDLMASELLPPGDSPPGSFRSFPGPERKDVDAACVPHVISANVPWPQAEIQKAASNGNTAQELSSFEPRDDVSCEVSCHGWSLSLCHGHQSMNRDFYQLVVPQLLACAKAIDGNGQATGHIEINPVQGGQIDNARNVAGSDDASIHSIGKAVDIFEIKVNGQSHRFSSDWATYEKAREPRPLDLRPVFWSQLTDCLEGGIRRDGHEIVPRGRLGALTPDFRQGEVEDLTEYPRDDVYDLGEASGRSALNSGSGLTPFITQIISDARLTPAELHASETDDSIQPPERLKALVRERFPAQATSDPSQVDKLADSLMTVAVYDAMASHTTDASEDERETLKSDLAKRALHSTHLHLGMSTDLKKFSDY